MFAQIGDRLVVAGDPARTGIIVGIPHDDGSPPYVVRWLSSGHIAMVSPDQFARVIPAGKLAGPGQHEPLDP
jgi:Domain of unknown function (DUF1918)